MTTSFHNPCATGRWVLGWSGGELLVGYGGELGGGSGRGNR